MRWFINSSESFASSAAISGTNVPDDFGRPDLDTSARSYKEVIQQDNNGQNQYKVDNGANITNEPPKQPEDDEDDDNGPKKIG